MKGKEAMEYAEFAVCIESGPGELKPILTGQVLTHHIPGLLMDIARLNDTMKCLRVVVNGHMVKRLDIKASSFRVLGEPVYGN